MEIDIKILICYDGNIDASVYVIIDKNSSTHVDETKITVTDVDEFANANKDNEKNMWAMLQMMNLLKTMKLIITALMTVPNEHTIHELSTHSSPRGDISATMSLWCKAVGKHG